MRLPSSPDMEKVIDQQSQVTMHFKLTLEDGTVVDSTFESDEPISFTMGDGTLIRGLEYAILGLKKGEQQSLVIPPEEGFGFSDESDMHEMKRSDFAADMDLKPGLVISFTVPNGLELPGTVVEVSDDRVKVDFSHPLANRTVTFNVKILDIQ